MQFWHPLPLKDKNDSFMKNNYILAENKIEQPLYSFHSRNTGFMNFDNIDLQNKFNRDPTIKSSRLFNTCESRRPVSKLLEHRFDSFNPKTQEMKILNID